MVILLEIGLILDCFEQYGQFSILIQQKEKTKYSIRENICQWYDDKRLISKMQLQLKQLSIKKQTVQLKTAEDLNIQRHFSKEDTQMTKRYMRRCSSLIIRKIQITPQMSYHLTSVTKVISKRPQINAGEGMGKRESQYTIDGNVNWFNQ